MTPAINSPNSTNWTKMHRRQENTKSCLNTIKLVRSILVDEKSIHYSVSLRAVNLRRKEIELS